MNKIEWGPLIGLILIALPWIVVLGVIYYVR